MQNLSRRRSIGLRTTLLTAAALCAFPLSAFAKDLPATAEGAQKLSDIFTTYIGKPAPGATSPITVRPEDGYYATSLDLASLAGPFKDSGFSLDPAVIKYKLTEQDDGTWRMIGDEFPAISAHVKEIAEAFEVVGYKFDGIFDPAIANFKSSQVGFDSEKVTAHAPQIDETFDIGPMKATISSTPAANSAVSMVAHEEFASLSGSILATPGGAKAAPDAKPVPISFQLAGILADVGLDGLSSRKVLDLWAFAVAHPSRAEIAANEPAFKELLRALLPSDFKLTEKVEMQKIAIAAPQGAFGFENGKFGFSAATTPGPNGSLEYSFAADSINFPPGLVPPAMHDLVPTAFNFDLKVSGFDVGASASEAIDDMHFAGDGPVISDADGQKILAKMKGSAPMVVELLPSHIVAPQVDLTIEGQARVEGPRPTGTMKVRARNFDKTIAALKALGQLASPQMIGGLAMAKSLAKTDADGSLIWVTEYGVDGSIKVNGLPLGKAP